MSVESKPSERDRFLLVGRVEIGASSAQLYSCRECGALVIWSQHELHTAWHNRTDPQR